MALIKCPECGKEVSDKASSCPNCGCPVQKMEPDKVENKEYHNQNKSAKIKKEKNGGNAHQPINKKKIGLICCIPIVIGIIGVGAYLGTANFRNYARAMKDYKNKSYEKAINEFESLGDYKESSEMVQKSTYDYAKILYEEEKYEDARLYFERIINYEDTQKYIDDCNYQLTIDRQFMRALSRGLMARWSKSNEDNENGLGYEDPDLYSEYCDLELKEIENFYDQVFENDELGKDSRKYIDLVKEAKDATKFYTVDYNTYSTKWSNVYAKRTMLLQKFVNEYGLVVDDEHQNTLDDLMIDASAAEEQQNIKDSIRKMTETFSISTKEDEWGYKTYKIKLKNTTERTFEYFYVDINVIDENGNIIGNGNMGQIESWKPGQEANTDVYFDEDISFDGCNLEYTPHYQTGSYFE